MIKNHFTVCPRSLVHFNIVPHYKNMDKNFLTYSKLKRVQLDIKYQYLTGSSDLISRLATHLKDEGEEGNEDDLT